MPDNSSNRTETARKFQKWGPPAVSIRRRRTFVLHRIGSDWKIVHDSIALLIAVAGVVDVVQALRSE
jgi:hypothetical protein